MTEFIFDENKIKKALITYCNKVNELYKAGNVESSYNKPIMDLISLFGCKPEDFSGGRSAEAGENVDIKLWHLEEDINDIPAFGAIEVKKVNGIDDRANKQILIEANKYGNVILTDNVSWRFYQKGEIKMYNGFVLLNKDENNNFVLDEEKIELFIQSIKDYLLTEPTTIKSSNKLAFYMAEHARTIKKEDLAKLNNKHFYCYKINNFSVKNISKDCIIIESIVVDDKEYVFSGDKLVESGKSTWVKTTENWLVNSANILRSIKLKCKDLIGNSYLLNCVFEVAYPNGLCHIETEIDNIIYKGWDVEYSISRIDLPEFIQTT